MANKCGNMETVTDFIFLGSKISADGDCSHEIKRRLLLGRKAMTDLDSILKSRDITLPPKVRLVKGMVFPVVMYGCENWTVKKLSAEKLMFLNCGVGEDSWESLGLQGQLVSWTKRSVLKEISPEYSLEGLMLKLKLQYLWSPDSKSRLIRQDPDSGKDWRQEEKGMTEDEMVGWHHWLNGHEFG